ncbi:hypothetical protein NL676_038489 [Syzygium grande]|nr:hypothetical protein NL676_038489 [Syzygium grande]
MEAEVKRSPIQKRVPKVTRIVVGDARVVADDTQVLAITSHQEVVDINSLEVDVAADEQVKSRKPRAVAWIATKNGEGKSKAGSVKCRSRVRLYDWWLTQAADDPQKKQTVSGFASPNVQFIFGVFLRLVQHHYGKGRKQNLALQHGKYDPEEVRTTTWEESPAWQQLHLLSGHDEDEDEDEDEPQY